MSDTNFKKQSIEKQQRIISTGIHAFSVNAYQDVNTDAITKACGISKGLLFHYFGSKKEYYLYCLKYAMQRLVEQNNNLFKGNFLDILFMAMDQKINAYKEYPEEMYFIDLALRENACEVKDSVKKISEEYQKIIDVKSMIIMRAAITSLPLKQPGKQKVMEGLLIYTKALMNRYIELYKNQPEVYFKDITVIHSQLKEYLELMLRGIST